MVYKLLDLFCGAGGCSAGYHKAGFECIGIDNKPQPNYPYEFIESDAIEFDIPKDIDIIHASPPCQKYSWAARRWKNIERVDLIPSTRQKLQMSGKPYIIENVIGAPLIKPITLCGKMFDLRVIRHRLFESNTYLSQPQHLPHNGTVRNHDYCTVAGHGGDGKSNLKLWKEAMDIDWMTRKEIIQAIPPAYTYYIGKQLMNYLQ